LKPVPFTTTGVTVPVTIWSRIAPRFLYGIDMLMSPPAVRLSFFVRVEGANVVSARRPTPS
jgi:hypothetical protein